MQGTLSERFVKKINVLEDSQASASDYLAQQRWLYRKKLNDAGITLPEIQYKDFADAPSITEGERYLDMFGELPDDLHVDVLSYIDWLKTAEDAEDDIAYCAEYYSTPGVINIRDIVNEHAVA